jgi:hypothetical protein
MVACKSSVDAVVSANEGNESKSAALTIAALSRGVAFKKLFKVMRSGSAEPMPTEALSS